MIPRIQIIIFFIITIITLFSCQQKTGNMVKELNNKIEIKNNITQAEQFYKNHNNIDSAFFYYNKAKLICDPNTDPGNYVSILNCMAEIQSHHGDFLGSETTIKNALPYLKSVKDQTQIWNTYTILGSNALQTYRFTVAEKYFNKALNLNIDENRKSLTKSNIANLLIAQQKYAEALKIFLRLSIKKEIRQKPESYANALDNIGFCYFKTQDPRGIEYLDEALQIRNKIKDSSGIGASNLNLATYYDTYKDSSQAKKHALNAYKSFRELGNIDDKLNAIKIIIKNSSPIDLKKYSLIYVGLVDSIFEVRQQAKNQFAKIKYDSKLEKQENLKLKTYQSQNELKLERQKNRNIISYIIIILSICLILILYYYLTSKANKDKIEAAYNSETRISKKLHDELANDIYHTMAFAENRNLSLAENKEQLLSNLAAIYSRTRDISRENCYIITDENYISSLKEMISGFTTLNINLILNGLDLIPWEEIEKDKKITIYRVLQELLVNMRKYSEASVVGISFKQLEKNMLINYNDNGKGIDTEKIIFKNGLHNVESRILKIKGAIDVSSSPNQGFKVVIKIPL